MALKPLSIDVATGKRKAGGVAPTFYDFDVGVGGQTQFTIGTVASSTYIEALVNGAERREGVTADWVRVNGAPGRVDFNSAVPQNAWVRIKVYP